MNDTMKIHWWWYNTRGNLGHFRFFFVNFKVAPRAYTRRELAWTSLFTCPNTCRFDSANEAELRSSTVALPSRSKGSAAECDERIACDELAELWSRIEGNPPFQSSTPQFIQLNWTNHQMSCVTRIAIEPRGNLGLRMFATITSKSGI